MAVKLKRTEVEQVKKGLIVEQGFICPICTKSLRGIPLSKVALDHCHDTGFVRGVAHMGCNRVEGVIKKALTTWARCGTFREQLSALGSLYDYLKSNRMNPKPMIYPTHKTPEEMAAARLKKARLAAKK